VYPGKHGSNWLNSIVSQPPYSPDLASCDFHPFPHLLGNCYDLDKEIEEAMKVWFRNHDGFTKLVPCWQKRVTLGGDYAEK
jgi:hypothetical protein